MRVEALKTLALLAATVTWQVDAQTAATPPYEAGKHYTEVPTPQPTSTEAGKIEVAEIFMFGCPGCYMMEPRIQAWLTRKPDYVSFVRIPAPWNPPAIMHARA
ncbi:MAG TPA: thiol:disulfide interchange protein, partial [Gammaproteobacteria bacterium]